MQKNRYEFFRLLLIFYVLLFKGYQQHTQINQHNGQIQIQNESDLSHSIQDQHQSQIHQYKPDQQYSQLLTDEQDQLQKGNLYDKQILKKPTLSESYQSETENQSLLSSGNLSNINFQNSQLQQQKLGLRKFNNSNENYQTKLEDSKIIDIQANDPTPKQTVVSMITNVLFIISGLYVGLYGFRAFKLLIIILGYYISYYVLLLTLKYTTSIDYNNNSIQFSILIVSLVLGFLFSMLCYFLQKSNFVVFGFAVGAMVSWFYCSFFVDFTEQYDLIILLGIFGITSLIFIIISYIWIDYSIIIGSALIGSLVVPINIGVLVGDFPSFENREKLRSDRFEDYTRHLIIALVIFMVGLSIQLYKRNQIAKQADLVQGRDSIHDDLELNDI